MHCAGRPIYWEETGLISTRFAELSTYFSVDDLTVQHVRMQELMRLRCEHAAKQGFVSSVSVTEVSLWLKEHDLWQGSSSGRLQCLVDTSDLHNVHWTKLDSWGTLRVQCTN